MPHPQNDIGKPSIYLLSAGVLLIVVSLSFEALLAYVDVGPFPPRNYSIPIAFAIITLYFFYRERVVVDTFVLFVAGLLVIMILWVAVVDTWNGVGAYTRFHRLGLFGISFFILIGTYVTARNKRVFQMYLWTIFCVIGVSSFVAAMQLLGMDLFWELRLLFGTSSQAIKSQLINQTRPAGLSLFAIQLGYQLSILVPLSFGLAYTRFEEVGSVSKLLFAVTLMLTAGLVATKTRSAIIGATVGCGLVVYFSGDSQLGRLRKLIPIAVAAPLVLFTIPAVRERFVDIGASAYSRVPMTVLALLVAKDNPLGVGTGQYDPEPYADHVEHLRGVGNALINTPHNQFLNTLVYYGIPGLLLLLTLYFLVFRQLLSMATRDYDIWTRRVAVSLLGGFTGYVINSFFHNAGAFVADPFHWYFIGLACALVYRTTGEGET